MDVSQQVPRNKTHSIEWLLLWIFTTLTAHAKLYANSNGFSTEYGYYFESQRSNGWFGIWNTHKRTNSFAIMCGQVATDNFAVIRQGDAKALRCTTVNCVPQTAHVTDYKHQF